MCLKPSINGNDNSEDGSGNEDGGDDEDDSSVTNATAIRHVSPSEVEDCNLIDGDKSVGSTDNVSKEVHKKKVPKSLPDNIGLLDPFCVERDTAKNAVQARINKIKEDKAYSAILWASVDRFQKKNGNSSSTIKGYT